MNEPLSEERRLARNFELGSKQLLYAITRAKAGLPTFANRHLVWNERMTSTERDPESMSFAYTVEAAERFRRRHEEVERLKVVTRDPCPYCATRQDIGCKHTRRVA